jgi:hypothetical protein
LCPISVVAVACSVGYSTTNNASDSPPDGKTVDEGRLKTLLGTMGLNSMNDMPRSYAEEQDRRKTEVKKVHECWSPNLNRVIGCFPLCFIDIHLIT